MTKKKLGKDVAFHQSRKQANKDYNKALIAMLEDCANLKSGDGRILFLDKNHPESSIRSVVEAIDDKLPRSVTHLKVYLTPEQSKQP